MPQAKVIVNPVAGAYSTRRKWPHINNRLRDIGLSFDYEYTEDVGHATELARAAANEGYQNIVAVGGDGTVHEVANGILSSNSSDIALGVISTGTGSDFIRSAGIPQQYISACSCLAGSRRFLIDVGIVEYPLFHLINYIFVNSANNGAVASLVAHTLGAKKTSFTEPTSISFFIFSMHPFRWPIIS